MEGKLQRVLELMKNGLSNAILFYGEYSIASLLFIPWPRFSLFPLSYLR